MLDLDWLTLRELYTVTMAMGSAVLVGLIISWLYRTTHRGFNYERSFPATLVLLAPIVAVIMLFIQGNLVLSLGLVGSLSIIRFRTAIKDSRDMVYLFWTIAAGLGCGTANWGFVTVSTAIIGSVICALYLLDRRRVTHAEFVLVVGGGSPCDLQQLGLVVGRHAPRVQIRSHELEGGRWETVFELRFDPARGTALDNLIREVREVEGVDKVSILAPQLALPM